MTNGRNIGSDFSSVQGQSDWAMCAFAPLAQMKMMMMMMMMPSAGHFSCSLVS